MSHDLGVDIAQVDEDKVDWARAKADGISFAFERGSWNNGADPTPAHDRDAIRGAGITFGGYVGPAIGKMYASPEQQIDVAVDALQLIPGKDFALVLDIEFPRGIAGTGWTDPLASIVDWVARAQAQARKRLNCTLIPYSSARVLDGTDTDCVRGALDKLFAGTIPWLARYALATRIAAQASPSQVEAVSAPPVPRYVGEPNGWLVRQYQGDSKGLSGFSATVDLDKFNHQAVGSVGAFTRWIQARVGADVDGSYGPHTEELVARFQASHGLEDHGEVDPATGAALTWVEP